MVAGVVALAGSVAPVAGAAEPAAFVRGDVNGDGDIDVSDPIAVLLHLFAGRETLPCPDAADADDSGAVELTDAVFALSFLYQGGAAPPPPFPGCGEDPTADALDCPGFPPCPWGALPDVVISEILAVNETSLRDADGERPDWVEITNRGTEPVDLAGFHLTDDAEDPTRWRFPEGAATRLEAGESLVVFASGRAPDDPLDDDGNLHASFRLDGDGEYLGLIFVDGATVLSEFAPRYPKQSADVSYGRVDGTVAPRILVAEGRGLDARWRVDERPPSPDWMDPDLEAVAWTRGEVGWGYEIDPLGVFTSAFATDVALELHDRPGSLWARIAFRVEEPSAVRSLTLWMRHDDAFVAYLGGVEVARSHLTAGDPDLAPTTADRPDAEAVGDMAAFPIAHPTSRLSTGRNVLAIRGVRADASAPRFLIVPVLEAVVAGSSEQFFLDPTPGAPNAPDRMGRVDDTAFSVDRGYYEAPIEVAITSSTPGATIRYTLDGSAPTESRGTVYSAPVPADGVMILRALAYRPGFLPTNVDTQTYLFLRGDGGVLRQRGDRPGYPSMWEGYPADYEMDPEITEHPGYRDAIEADMKALPVVSVVTAREHLFGASGIYTNAQSRGIAWERPTSVEIFTADGQEEVQIDCGIRVQGGAGRRPEHPKKSFRLIFREAYGAGKLRCDLFRDQPYGRESTGSFDKLVLRGGFNNTFPHWYDEQGVRSQYVRDQWARDLQFEMGHRSTGATRASREARWLRQRPR